MNPFYKLATPEGQIEIINSWIDQESGSEETNPEYLFRQMKNNLNLLRFYKQKFGKISLEEYVKWLEENNESFEKKQLWDMTLREIMHECDKTKDCANCPFKHCNYCWDEIRSENDFSQELELK